MRKLKLRLDDLTVEAFKTLKASAGEGTVVGHAPTLITTPCAGSCFDSCGGTCPMPCTYPDCYSSWC